MAFTASNGRTQVALADINITPLVDVVLVLLIIFMVTAPVLQSGIEVAVPKTRTVKEITEERMVISIDKQQRVFLARALMANPRLLLLDEPTSGVDIKTRDDILHLLADLNADGHGGAGAFLKDPHATVS